MGLYIPPPSDSSSSSSSSSIPTGGNNGGKKSNTFTFTFYTRPSVGLKMWGPFVPASDCRTGLYTLTGLQTLIGLLMFRTVRVNWRNNTFYGRLNKVVGTLAGSYTVFNAGLEISRLSLPYDPWVEEAKEAREVAEAHGKKVNWWFGPWDFKPMGFDQWNEKIEKWIVDQESSFERGKIAIVSGPEMKEGYEKIKEINKVRQSKILSDLQTGDFAKNLDEMRKASKSVGTAAFESDRPTLLVPEDNELENDDDLDEVWWVNDPWESLGQDVDYIVRFIPKYNWIQKMEAFNKEREQKQKEAENASTEEDKLNPKVEV